MSNTYSFNYRTLVDFFDEDTIINRTNNLHKKIVAFVDDSGLENLVYINEPLLRRTVIDYFADIYRLRTFHGIDAVNRHKIVAYTALWLLRRKPIQLRENTNNNDAEKLVFVNENFVATLIAYSCVTPSSSPELMYVSRVKLDEERQKNLMRFLGEVRYHLRYRMVDAQNLELMLSAYETGFNLGESKPSRIQIPK